MNRILARLRPSPAMVVACAALLFALTGAGYAAGVLGPNTVGTKQLKKNAVISTKVKNRSLLAVDFKAGQLPRGAQGARARPGPMAHRGARPTWADLWRCGYDRQRAACSRRIIPRQNAERDTADDRQFSRHGTREVEHHLRRRLVFRAVWALRRRQSSTGFRSSSALCSQHDEPMGQRRRLRHRREPPGGAARGDDASGRRGPLVLINFPDSQLTGVMLGGSGTGGGAGGAGSHADKTSIVHP